MTPPVEREVTEPVRFRAGLGRSSTRTWRWGVGLTALCVLALALSRASTTIHDHLAAPFDLIYETPTLRTIEILEQGGNPYAAEWYAEDPYWITMYTPLYPWLSSVLPGKDDNPFWTGRVLTTIAIVLAAALTLVAARGRALIAALGAGAFLLVPPTTSGLAILRPDGLAVCLSAVSVAVLAGREPRCRLAAIFTVLALLTKQSAMAGPMACFAYLALRDRRLCARYVGWSLAIGGMGMVGLSATCGDGFWFSTLTAPRNPVASYLVWLRGKEMLRQPVFVAILVGAALLFVRSARGIASVVFRTSPFPIYAISAALWITAICGKLGSDAAYFVEPALAATLLLCDGAARALRRHQGRSWVAPVFVLVAGASLFQVLAVTSMAHARTTPEETTSRLEGLETARIRLAGQTGSASARASSISITPVSRTRSPSTSA